MAPPEIDPSCPGCRWLMEQLAELRGVVAKQGAEIEGLKAKRPKTSRNSSKSPSGDGPWSKRHPSPKPKSGKKQGGQPGHAGNSRTPVEPGELDEVKQVKPTHCEACAEPLTGDDPSPRMHQVIDIPPVKPVVVGYEIHALTCACCGETTKGQLPPQVHQSSFGPNVSALVVLLSGEYRMSRRNIQRHLADFHGIEISLGAISNIEGRMMKGLAGAHAEAKASVAASATKHLDETTWRESNELAWLWTAVGEDATVFVIRDTRSSSVATELIGEDPSGIVITDRYSGYSFINLDQRQVCLAHLMRDFRRMAEGEKDLRWIGQRLLGLTDALFRLWHQHQAGKINRANLKRWSRPIRTQMVQLLDQGARSRGYETPSMCRGILKTEPAIWTFIHREGVEPTNNVAERAVRPAVIHRKTSLGSQSDRGSRFVERMQTVSATLRQTGRSISKFIRGVADAVLGGAPEPRLLQ